MTGFSLTSGTDTYAFDISGGVSIGGNAPGLWTTNATNQIVATLPDTSVRVFDVAWMFNAKNQLTIQWQNAELFNFSTKGMCNSFTTRNTELVVKPDRAGTFSFTLQGDWGLNPDHNLTFTVNGVTSTLEGFVSDPLGRFIFHFANKDNLLETNVLGFAGSWQSKVDADGSLPCNLPTPTFLTDRPLRH